MSLDVYFSDTDYLSCSMDGEILDGETVAWMGKLTCPKNIKEYCSLAIECPLGCSMNGFCLGGTC